MLGKSFKKLLRVEKELNYCSIGGTSRLRTHWLKSARDQEYIFKKIFIVKNHRNIFEKHVQKSIHK